MRTSNPVLTRLGAAAAQERAAQAQVFGQAAPPYPTADGVLGAPPSVRPMTVDDVVVRTVGLLALVGLSAAAMWTLVPNEALGGLTFGAAMVGLVLGMVIAFARVTNPLVIGAYAVIEGAFVGGISEIFNAAFRGIVLQAVVGTFGVFFLMAILYKSGRIRATPRFIRVVTGAILASAAIILVNLGLSLFGIQTPLRDGGPIAILFSLAFIVVAALSFILSFHEVEEGVRLGLPQKYAWACAFGILVSLIWLYIEVLRLLSYFSGE